MGKILIVYGSTTGNTEHVAEVIGGVLQKAGNEVVLKNVTDAGVSELGDGYDLTLLGVSTWGDEEIEFQEDFEPFYQDMDNAQLQDKKVALFGCGDSSYQYFCGAVIELRTKVDTLGANVINEPLLIDGDPSVARSEIEEWAEEVGRAV
ncbi:flavodoxin [Desulfonatronum thioautotrophicum]|uniref:flavodoxin n=1 Tax=Desulfonatronum thioautotrophicum TaxID=617001 RepID=UPI0005EB2A41|nr:flavodoxin [Desulfonatronum thioautotrophicum]